MLPAFDVEAALQCAEGDADLLGELLSIFVNDAPAQLEAVRTAVARKEPAAVKAAAHCLKGSLRVLGAGPGASLAQELEQCGATGQLGESDRLTRALDAEMVRLMAAI